MCRFVVLTCFIVFGVTADVNTEKNIVIGLRGTKDRWFVSAQRDSSIEVNRKNYLGWEHITVEPDEDSKNVYFKSFHGKYLSAQPNGKLEWNRSWKRAWERFEIHRHGDKVALKSYHGKWVSAQPNFELVADKDTVGSSELFEVYPPESLDKLKDRNLVHSVEQPGYDLLKKHNGHVRSEQSSTYYGLGSDLVIDGNTNGNFNARSCMRTQESRNNWWSVTLPNEATVSQVIVYNRKDNWNYWIDGAKVYVGDVFCEQIVYKSHISIYRIKCDNIIGNVIKIVQNENYLSLCEVKVMGSDDLSFGNKLSNVARGHPTMQTTEGYGGSSSRAVDGNTMGIYYSASCTHSANSGNNWWRVDLIEKYDIESVIIHNRKDCCTGRLDGAKVYIDNEEFGNVVYKKGQSVYKIPCNKTGRRIKISQSGQFLTLCEVEVLARRSKEESILINVAQGAKATQDSTSDGSVASLAIDGNTNGDFFAGSCSHTAGNTNSWWKVELNEEAPIAYVVVYNRKDCCSDRIDGAQVFVDDWKCGTIKYKKSQHVYQIYCRDPVRRQVNGKSVTIKGTNGQFLTLCEVKVMSNPKIAAGKLINLAYKKPTKQSSTAHGGVSRLAVDGNQSGNYGSGSCTHTSFKGYWEVDLLNNYNVMNVVIKNRQDCCGNRINGVEVYVGGKLCGKVKYREGSSSYKVPCEGGVVGDNVRIVNNQNSLTLCEVMVFGEDTVITESTDKEIKGNLSGSSDDGRSVATCPTGYTVKDCKVVKVENGALNKENGAGVIHQFSKENVLTLPLTEQPVEEYDVQVPCLSTWFKIFLYDSSGKQTSHIEIYNRYRGNVFCNEAGNKKWWGGAKTDFYFSEHAKCNGTLTHFKIVKSNEGIQIYNDHTRIYSKVFGGYDGICSTTSSQLSTQVFTRNAELFISVKEGGEVHKTSDGAHISESGNECIATNSYRGSDVVAKAVCALNDQHENPCKGPNLSTYKHFFSKGPNPILNCPKGYNQTVCNAWSPWTGKLNGVRKDGTISNDLPCKQSGCSERNWCAVSNACKLVDDMTKYKSTVCSTCDGYHCEDEKQCIMLDLDDDETDAKVPTCIDKPTGCDNNDRCGSKGECIPVGGSGYTCDCGDGEEFSELTGSCLPVHTNWTKVYGEDAKGDDAISTAECPENMSVMRCFSHGIPTATDGVYISGDDSKCIARASHKKLYGIKAVAYCGVIQEVVDRCTQDKIQTTEYRMDSGLSPSIQCPAGYLMSSCIFHSPWSQLMTEPAKGLVNSIGSVKVNDNGTCSVPNCVSQDGAKTQWCKVTAICTKLVGKEYLKAACPTCDQVRCPEDYVCEIAEGLPQCLPRVKGPCEDVNQCGDAGVCTEIGTNYTCTCDSGYIFDGKTCQDVNECAEDPCGNGECKNSLGSYSCNCMTGYTLKKGTCVDIDECKNEPCKSSETCSNTAGSYVCDCLNTFIRNKAGACVCAEGFEAKEDKCEDIDECKSNPCQENEECTNSVGNYECACCEGFERTTDGTCEDMTTEDCNVVPEQDVYKVFRRKAVTVKLRGAPKKDMKKFAEIKWTKDGEVWDPAIGDKELFNGFKIWKFKPEDAGTYVGTIFIDNPKKPKKSKCQFTLRMVLVEGSATMEVTNKKKLMADQKVGKKVAIQCTVTLTNVPLKNIDDPNNVNWYKVVPNEPDQKMENGDFIEIKKKPVKSGKGIYTMWFKNPRPEDSGVYKCEFDQAKISAFTSIPIVFK